MSALAEALVAAQRAAITAIAKAHVAGLLPRGDCEAMMDAIGATDAVDQTYLLEALAVIREWGAEAPKNGASYQERRTNEPATQPQLDLIAKLIREGKHEPADTSGLTKAKASELISELQTGRYDPAKWSVPF